MSDFEYSLHNSVLDFDSLSVDSNEKSERSSKMSVSSSNHLSPKGRRLDMSYETVTSSVFSDNGSDILDNYYASETSEDVDSVNTKKLIEDNASGCYSFILDLLVDYDEMASIFSGKSGRSLNPRSIKARESQHFMPNIDSVMHHFILAPEDESGDEFVNDGEGESIEITYLDKPHNIVEVSVHGDSTTIEQKSTFSDIHNLAGPQTPYHESSRPTTPICAVRKPKPETDYIPKTPKGIVMDEAEFRQRREKEKRKEVDSQSVRNINEFENIKSIPSAAEYQKAMSNNKFNNDFTVQIDANYSVSDDSDPSQKRKTLKHRVLMTKNSFIQGMKRFSTWGRKSTSALHNDFNRHSNMTLEHSHTVKTQFEDTDRKSKFKFASAKTKSFDNLRNATQFSLGGKVSLKRSRTTNSMALTRLSGNYTKMAPFQNFKDQAQSNPLPKMKTKSVLVKNPNNNLFSMYNMDNPYAEVNSKDQFIDHKKNKRVSLVATNVNLKNYAGNLERIQGTKEMFKVSGPPSKSTTKPILSSPKRMQDVSSLKSGNNVARPAYTASKMNYNKVQSGTNIRQVNQPKGAGAGTAQVRPQNMKPKHLIYATNQVSMGQKRFFVH